MFAAAIAVTMIRLKKGRIDFKPNAATQAASADRVLHGRTIKCNSHRREFSRDAASHTNSRVNIGRWDPILNAVFCTGYAPNIISIIAPVKSSHRSPNLACRIGLLPLLVFVCSCDSKFFGPDSRELAGGYGLKRVEDSNQIALTIPNRAGGIIIDEIGWREPFIIARASGSDYWETMDTAHARRVSISDKQRKAEATYQSIQTEAAETAWSKLSRNKRLW